MNILAYRKVLENITREKIKKGYGLWKMGKEKRAVTLRSTRSSSCIKIQQKISQKPYRNPCAVRHFAEICQSLAFAAIFYGKTTALVV